MWSLPQSLDSEEAVRLPAAAPPIAAAPIKRKSGVLEDAEPSTVPSAANGATDHGEAGRGETDHGTAAVPPEPLAGGAGVVELAVRLPNGRAQRRFMDSDTVAAVETWLRREGHDMDQQVLSRQWPRKVTAEFSDAA